MVAIAIGKTVGDRCVQSTTKTGSLICKALARKVDQDDRPKVTRGGREKGSGQG